MPTARELLEQADALMRRNRTPEQDADIPELTDEIAVAASRTPSRVMLASRPATRQRHSRDDDVPELNDAVEELSIHPLPDDAGEVSRWLEADLGESSITGPAPDSIAVVPPSTLRAAPAQASAASYTEAQTPIAVASTTVAPTATATLAARVAGTIVGPPAEPPPASDPGFEAMLGAAPVEAAFEEELTPSALAPVASLPRAEPSTRPRSCRDAAAAAPDEHHGRASPRKSACRCCSGSISSPIPVCASELAARLQPIVDRASADIVATINRRSRPDPSCVRRRSHRARDREVAREQSMTGRRAAAAVIVRAADCR